MDCPYCDAELMDEGPYGRYYHGSIDPSGYIYRCPNHEGFQSFQEAQDYIIYKNPDYIPETWEEVCCGSAVHHVSGSFYTDRDGNLHPGYPC